MKLFGKYIGAGLGATAFEIQVGQHQVNILRPRYYFWPYRPAPTASLLWPRFVSYQRWLESPKGLTDNPITDYWYEHYVSSPACLCSLCGNTGKIDTRGRAVSGAGVHSGGLHYCICPNGQVMRHHKLPLI